ncbi:MAG: hypothetical protein J6K84_03390 [Oscillospiraceae bacterium]|nr:hypothetical protein [Oscillospiraceae bacterium]
MKLFDQNNVLIELLDLFFDENIEGAVTKIKIVNDSEYSIDIDLCDIWDDNQWLDFWFMVKDIPPHSSTIKTLYHLASDDESKSILKFLRGEIETFCCHIGVRKSQCYNYSTYGKGGKIQVSALSLSNVKIFPKEEFEIECDEETLFAPTDHYIPFEISKTETEKAYQIRTFKQELIKKLELLPSPQFGRVLMAQYGEIGKSRFFDIENMCIYNLGISVFSKSCPSDIVFSELTKEEIASLNERFDISSNRKYYYSYSWILPDHLDNICRSKTLIARWNSIAIKTDLPNTPHRYWLSIREQYKDVNVCGALAQPSTDNFGIKIVLHLPKKALPAGIMKAVLDGVVCAFHHRQDDNKFLLQLTNEKFEDVIQNAEKFISLFGERDYVNTYRENSIKWNPADERLKFAWISVIEENCTPYFDGEVYQW